MMKRMAMGVLAAGFVAPAAVGAQAWIAPARDDGVAVACRTAADPVAFKRALDRAGWSKYGRRRPLVDFARDIAVIVAPGRFRANADLQLVDRVVAGNRRIVRWRFAPREQVAERTEESFTLGSSGPPGKEILVVAFPRSAIKLPQSCLGAY